MSIKNYLESISLEYINPKGATALGIGITNMLSELNEKITELKETSKIDFNNPPSYVLETEERLRQHIRKHTGIPLNFFFTNATRNHYYTLCYLGKESNIADKRSGSRGYTEESEPLLENMETLLGNFDIDLDRGFISNIPKDTVNMAIYIDYYELINNKFTPNESTAVILHEIGHCFCAFLTLADTVYFNYILKEGVDVVLGNKPNKYKLKILSLNELGAIDDKELAKRVKEEPNEENIRLAIMSTMANPNRHYLHSKSVDISHTREEELADMFASRWGYGADLAKALAKMNNTFKYRMTTSERMLLALWFVIVPYVVLFCGLTLCLCAVYHAFQSKDYKYPEPLDRLKLIRADLIAQAKYVGKKDNYYISLFQEVQAIDELIRQYKDNTRITDFISFIFSPKERRTQLTKKKEELYQSLINNDLGLQALQFKHHKH